LAHATTARGAVQIDEGAVRALRQRQASLLAAGVVGASGTFLAGEPVDIVGPDGATVARGLVAYDAGEFDRLVGRTTADLIAEFGPDYEREIVHRDDLVLL
jgi:glutamate 5-kinase